jgi:putative (di)nucleoside polyphosphate hydrolase
MMSTFSMPQDCYREAASILLLRPVTEGSWDEFEVFLIHKPRKKDAWQLPQGGKEEGEISEQCAIRELKEEAGIVGVQILGVSDKVYTYDFPKSFRKFRPDNICGQTIAYLIGTVSRDVPVTVDNVEVDDFRWLSVEDIPAYVKRKEYLALIHELVEEARGML